jgi:hypothetical protein
MCVGKINESKNKTRGSRLPLVLFLKNGSAYAAADFFAVGTSEMVFRICEAMA